MVDGLEGGVELGNIAIIPGTFGVPDSLGENVPLGEGSDRAAPITILQRLGLVQEIVPLSNFYFKIKLAAKTAISWPASVS